MTQCTGVKPNGCRCLKKSLKGMDVCFQHNKLPSATRIGTVLRDLAEWFANLILARYFMYSEIINEREHKCFYCGKDITEYNRSRDHITNFIKDKKAKQISSLSNKMVLCCSGCNSSKNGKDFEEFSKRPIEDVIDPKSITWFYYDQKIVDDCFEKIENVILEVQIILSNMVRCGVFTDENEFNFTQHILTDDFVMIYDSDILQLENLRMRVNKLVNESS